MYVLRTQRNLWLHILFALGALGISAWLKLDVVQWAIIVLTIAMVFAAEFLNTAVELVVDLVSPRKRHLAKLGKDVAAAGVLITALGAALVGILILGPPLLLKIQSLLER
jgi:diacylglycerol kinase (ATP)